MYLLILFLPIFNSFLLGFFGRFIGKKGSIFFSILCLFSSFLISLIIFYEVIINKYVCYIYLFYWINIGELNLKWEFLFDSITATMLLLVTFVSFLVHLYSINYMSEDPHFIRFFSYLSLFTFFMIVLVTSGNVIQLFMGWEGVGLASYLLINFWFTRVEANKAALKAVIVNRFGDFSFYLAIVFLFYIFKTFNFCTIFSLSYLFIHYSFLIFSFQINFFNLVALCLFIGAVGKSAQIGLHIWLPDAMEGPTPVSALIHAATMVTAGIFLIIRFSPILEYSPNILLFISFIGGLTAFFAATIGFVQYDIKKIIAYSTCSQLGYMIFSCGLSNYSVSFFHLVNHGFFKALLFLGAGSVIHAISNDQDIRKMGGLVKFLPFTYIIILIGSLSLIGFPFLTGFYSKDLIIELAFSQYFVSYFYIYWLGVISASLTAFYSCRLIYFVFFLNKTNLFKSVINSIHDSPLFMTISLFCLSFGSIFFGYIMKDLFVGLGTDVWQNSIFNLYENIIILDSEFLPSSIKLIPVIFSLFGILFFFLFYLYFFNSFILDLRKNWFLNIYKFLSKKWYFDLIYNHFILKIFFFFSYFISFKLIDRGFIEVLGSLGIIRFSKNYSIILSKFHSGFIYHYIFLIIIGCFFFCFFCFSSLMFLTFFSFSSEIFLLYLLIILFCFYF